MPNFSFPGITRPEIFIAGPQIVQAALEVDIIGDVFIFFPNSAFARFVPVTEPDTLSVIMLALGLLGLVGRARRTSLRRPVRDRNV